VTWTKEQLEPLLRRSRAQPDPAAYLAEQMARVETIQREVARLDEQERREQKRHQQALRDLQARREQVQAECPHLRVTYHGDPSGGFDSEEACGDCGERAKWLEREEAAR
jgi:hypothetical protein